MAKIELVIFDVDGTLLDTKEGIVSSVKQASRMCGLPDLREDMIERTFIGPPIAQGFQTAFGLEGESLNKAVAVFRESYIQHDLLRARPYEGIYDVLDFLKKHGIKTAIATYKRDDYAKKLLAHFRFNEYTSNIHGSDQAGQLKKSDLIELCISDSGCCDRSAMLMVGDAESDAKGAKKAGVEFLGVTYGYGFSSSDDHGFATAAQPLKILDYLKDRRSEP